VRVDSLPNKLFAWNGKSWMELSKELTYTYLVEDYVEHLTDKVQDGEIDPEDLTDHEQEEVENAIKRRSSNTT
jgi:hypothetical protein|tara:strand:- start:645 stop:863 length:219 start_codon:yes stop_codon:yes gene_type:complete